MANNTQEYITSPRNKPSIMSKKPTKFKEGPFEYHEEIDLNIDSLTNLGAGLGRIDGWVIMVPFALPGERIRARIFRNHSSHSDADLLEVITTSGDRVEPRCPLFGECGGCQYQHLKYEKQLAWKTQQVTELVERIGKLDTKVLPAIASPKQYGYRSKLTPHYPSPKIENFPIGFLRHGRRNSIIDVAQCPIATKEINEALPEERELLRERIKAKKRGGTMLLRHTLEGVTTDGNAIVSEQVAGRLFQFTASDFFQNNPYILPRLIEYVIKEAASGKMKYLIDAYCGVGLFCISASSYFERLVGIEISASSIRWARTNAEISKTENCEFLIGDAGNLFSRTAFSSENTAVIIDPPRKGCSLEFISQLAKYGPARIIYVSCAPDTQARDLAVLQQEGYKTSHIQPFDLFPQTRHIESVATLEHMT